MIAIIEGKRYDTSTGILIGDVGSSGTHSGDFRHWTATLYVTKNGRFFMCGAGGAASPFAQPVNNGFIGGGGVKSVTEEAALRWCEDNLAPDKYERHFDIEEA